MVQMRWCSWIVCLALAGAFPPFVGAAGKDAPTPKVERQVLTGKVLPLAEVLAKLDVRLDPDARDSWYALVTDEGKVYPLIKDEGCRMFFQDTRLLRRPMRLTGRVLPNSQLLQVLEVRSLVKGKLHEVFYWCDVCTIKRFENKICDCCGGPLELREKPIQE